MKILFVSDQYYPLGGGIEQYLRGLARQLTIWGHKVIHLARSIEGCPQEESWPEGRVIRTPLLLDAVSNPEIVLDRWPQLVGIIESVKPDVVYANNHTSLAAIKACKQLGIPVVHCCHGWGLLCPLKIRFLKPDNSLCYNKRSIKNCLNCYKMMMQLPKVTGLRTAITRFRQVSLGRKHIAGKVSQYDSFQDILENADARIANSSLTASMFISNKTFAIYLGLDSNEFHPVPYDIFRDRYNIKGQYILMASRIHNVKGQEWAIRAMVNLPSELKLLIGGNTSMFGGPKYEENIHSARLGRLIEELRLQDRVIFTGFLTKEELVEAYSGALATLVPSVWLEPFGYVTVEAMACECPVVVTTNCGTAELVRDGVDGFIVPRMDYEVIAKAVLKILQHRKRMGQIAREKIIQDLNWQKIAKSVLEVFEGAI